MRGLGGPPSRGREAVAGAIAKPDQPVRFWKAMGDLVQLVLRSRAPGLRWRVTVALLLTLAGKVLGVLAPLLLGAAVNQLAAGQGAASPSARFFFRSASADAPGSPRVRGQALQASRKLQTDVQTR